MSRRNWAAAPMAIVVGTAGMGAADAQETALPAIEVSAQRATAPFRTRESTSATRSEADVMEIPFAVSSVDTKLIQTVAATRGDDLYDWVAGVSRQNNFGGLGTTTRCAASPATATRPAPTTWSTAFRGIAG